MLRTFSVLALSGLLASTVTAAPAVCSGARFLDPGAVSRYYLTADGRCVANGQCPDATFVDKTTNTCAKCYSPNYKTCSSAASTAATSCMNNTCLPPTGGRCLPFANIKNTSYCTPAGVVAACPGAGVKTCRIGGIPLSCNAPYFFTTTERAATSGDAPAPEKRKRQTTVTVGGTCVLEPECPIGTFGDESTRTCSSCGTGASRCTIEGAEKCYDGWFLLDKHCYNPCPDGYQGQDGVCVEVPTALCSTKTDFFNPFTNSCTDICPDTASFTAAGTLPSTYPDEESMTCSSCQGDNIFRCDQTSGFAAECVDGFFLLDGGCFTSCPEGMKGLNGVCVDQSYCPDGLVYESYTQQCGEGCYDATEMDGIAIPAEYISEDGKTCLVCKSENAQQCNQQTGLAVSCIDGYFLLDGQCLNPCPEGYEGKEGVCVEKEQGCDPASYIDPYTGACVATCPAIATVVAGVIQPATRPDGKSSLPPLTPSEDYFLTLLRLAATHTCVPCGANVYECEAETGKAVQ
ncbi:hypothetical protein JCM6882_006805, partial [Rhodosporidiobolus microsporus]